MAEAILEMSGAERAAIFLLGLGEAAAAVIMRHMAPKEVQVVGAAMASLSDVTNEQIASVVEDFVEKVTKVNPIGIGTGDYTRRVMVQALGENRARSMLNKVMQSTSSKGMDALKWMDARAVFGLVKNEHPQIIAIVLASLEGDQAAQVLQMLPAELRTDVVLRIARLDLIDPKAMEELDMVLEKQLGDHQEFPPTSVDGLTSAAGILNHLNNAAETEMLDALKEADAELGNKIQELMFVFDNLLVLDDKGMQRLIREISVDSLVIALRGVDAPVRDKFLDNMSKRAAEMLKDDLDSKGPVKLSEVETAQKEILTIAGKLADDGEISLGNEGDDFV